MGILDRLRQRADSHSERADAEYEEEKALETAKIRAFRTANEMAAASAKLLRLAEELKAEIEAIESD